MRILKKNKEQSLRIPNKHEKQEIMKTKKFDFIIREYIRCLLDSNRI